MPTPGNPVVAASCIAGRSRRPVADWCLVFDTVPVERVRIWVRHPSFSIRSRLDRTVRVTRMWVRRQGASRLSTLRFG